MRIQAQFTYSKFKHSTRARRMAGGWGRGEGDGSLGKKRAGSVDGRMATMTYSELRRAAD